MKFSIAYLPGDGIGPEIGAAALQVLDAVSSRFGHEFDILERPFGGAAIDAAGAPFPDATKAAVDAADAVLLGAVGGPAWDHLPGAERPEKGLLALRKHLDAFANIRPVKPHSVGIERSPLRPEKLEGVDFVVVRELTGGAYFGPKKREGDRAEDVCVYTVGEIERIARRAGDIARGRSGRVLSVDKANVLETSRLWRETVTRVFAEEYSDLELAHGLVDAVAMQLLTGPADFDVIVTENLFGDILTDEASVLLGSLGLAPSASLSDGSKGLYEPIHGSAPDIAGKGIANPTGMILSAAAMLRWSFALNEEADAIESAVDAALTEEPLTADLGGNASTMDIANRVSAIIAG